MPFIRIPGKPGHFFVCSASAEGPRRFACVDCRNCQWCSDVRCRACRGSAAQSHTAAPGGAAVSSSPADHQASG